MKGGKLFGGLVGWAFLGPLGAAIGLALGHLLDSVVQIDRIPDPKLEGSARRSSRGRRTRPKTTSADFNVSLVVLTAAMMKADGKVLKSELAYVKTYFSQQFGQENSKQYLSILKDLLDEDIDLIPICRQIKFYMNHSNRLLLMQFLLGLANADNELHGTEVQLIRTIGRYLGISSKDIDSIFGIERGASKAPYEILEISPDATDKEVKSAYRRMANKYHPDKVRNLGPEHLEAAENRFIEVQKAYEVIKKSRKMK